MAECTHEKRKKMREAVCKIAYVCLLVDLESSISLVSCFGGSSFKKEKNIVVIVLYFQPKEEVTLHDVGYKFSLI